MEKSSSAILRRMRRMILPERVFGRPGENWIWSGEAIGADLLAHMRDQLLAQLLARLLAGHQRHVAVDALALDVVRIADHGGLGHLGWETSADSTSAVPRRWPETLITSSTRPVIQ